MSIGQIIEGTIKNLLNQEEELYESRVKICRDCVLITDNKIFGEMCNRALYIKPGTNQISRTYKRGYINGCGCVISSKARLIDEKCPLGKW